VSRHPLPMCWHNGVRARWLASSVPSISCSASCRERRRARCRNSFSGSEPRKPLIIGHVLGKAAELPATPLAFRQQGCGVQGLLMGWSGRAPAPVGTPAQEQDRHDDRFIV
jgi:hypothetical protein